MTLAEAVAVLNERRHRDHDSWRRGVGGEFVRGEGQDRLDAFETVAIAEKYQREARDDRKT